MLANESPRTWIALVLVGIGAGLIYAHATTRGATIRDATGTISTVVLAAAMFVALPVADGSTLQKVCILLA